MGQLLLLFSLSKLGFFVRFFAKKLGYFVVVGHLLCIAFAIVAAECNRSSLEFNGGILVELSARERTSLLFNLLGSNQLMVCLGSECLFVSIKFLEAVATAEIDFPVFPIAGISFLRGCAGHEALELIDSNLFLKCQANGSKGNNERKQTDYPRILHMYSPRVQERSKKLRQPSRF